MSTNLKGVTCKVGEVSMTRFFGGHIDGKCVQLTFKKPEEECNRSGFGYWYLQLTRADALEMAAALVEFANNTREEVE
jgi:hypothetical protein